MGVKKKHGHWGRDFFTGFSTHLFKIVYEKYKINIEIKNFSFKVKKAYLNYCEIFIKKAKEFKKFNIISFKNFEKIIYKFLNYKKKVFFNFIVRKNFKEYIEKIFIGYKHLDSRGIINVGRWFKNNQIVAIRIRSIERKNVNYQEIPTSNEKKEIIKYKNTSVRVPKKL